MRILYIVHHFLPIPLGGADMVTYHIAAEARRRGHEPWILCMEDLHDPTTGRDEVRVTNEPYDGLPVRRLHLNWEKMSDPYGALYVSNPAIEKLTAQYIAEVQPDVVHITACDYVTMAVFTAAKQAGLPVALTLTGKWHICPSATLLKRNGELCGGRRPPMECLQCMFGETRTYRLLGRLPGALRQSIISATGLRPQWFARVGSLNFMHAVARRNAQFPKQLAQSDVIFSPSHCHVRVFAACGALPAQRIEHSLNGADTTAIAAAQEKTASSVIRFGYTGQIVSHKGVHTIVQAFQTLENSAPCELHIFGNLKSQPAYGEQVRALAQGNPHIHFGGAYDKSDLTAILSSIDVVIVASTCIENVPLTIPEAFAAGTPVIGSDVCGVEEMIQPGVNGLLFRRGDAQDLARQMLRVVEDPDLLPTLRSGIKPPRTIASHVDELEARYRALVAGKGPARDA